MRTRLKGKSPTTGSEVPTREKEQEKQRFKLTLEEKNAGQKKKDTADPKRGKKTKTRAEKA